MKSPPNSLLFLVALMFALVAAQAATVDNKKGLEASAFLWPPTPPKKLIYSPLPTFTFPSVPIYKPKPKLVPIPTIPIYKPEPKLVPIPTIPIYKPEPKLVPIPTIPIYKPKVKLVPTPIPIYKPKVKLVPPPIPIYKPKLPIYNKPPIYIGNP
ncbi:proline-rich protein 4-like [Impatiens glandulifera]|uniref:proline-rich protein 4-like n=1 Tax=Impatiens glandulifera TaxID=253017 RepID=UPI001FB0CFBA|nr:proline-rich protein 4-like [Impatiens glandulifera]